MLCVDFLLHVIYYHIIIYESLVMFGIQPATNMSATCANAFGLNTMSSGSAHSRFHKISMVAFVAGMAARQRMTLGSLVGFCSSKIGPRIIPMHVVSHPQAALQISTEVSPSLNFSAIWFSPSSHRVTAKSCTDLGRMELAERGQMLMPSHARKHQRTTTNVN